MEMTAADFITNVEFVAFVQLWEQTETVALEFADWCGENLDETYLAAVKFAYTLRRPNLGRKLCGIRPWRYNRGKYILTGDILYPSGIGELEGVLKNKNRSTYIDEDCYEYDTFIDAVVDYLDAFAILQKSVDYDIVAKFTETWR
jgi:hypothetical protein